jgi:hypothetical protein
MTTIYILQLEEGKYYVGKTRNIEQRLNDHYHDNGSEWTKKYKPVKTIQIVENCDDFDEDKYVLINMSKYGIDNVRGGTYSNPILDALTIEHIEKMIDSAKDRCFTCGKGGHFAKNCSKVSPKNNSNVNTNEQYAHVSSVRTLHFKCDRCGRSSHLANNCFAKTDKNGKLINERRRLPPNIDPPQNVFGASTENSSFRLRKELNVFAHSENIRDVLLEQNGTNPQGSNNNNSTSRCIQEDVAERNNSFHECSRCGRTSHTIDKCYAKTHINGNLIDVVPIKPIEKLTTNKMQVLEKVQDPPTSLILEQQPIPLLSPTSSGVHEGSLLQSQHNNKYIALPEPSSKNEGSPSQLQNNGAQHTPENQPNNYFEALVVTGKKIADQCIIS